MSIKSNIVVAGQLPNLCSGYLVLPLIRLWESTHEKPTIGGEKNGFNLELVESEILLWNPGGNRLWIHKPGFEC